MKTEYSVGSKVRVSSDQDDVCYDHIRNEVLIVTAVATSKAENPHYEDVVGEPLYNFKTASGKVIKDELYEHEIVPA